MTELFFIRHGKTYGNTLGRYIGTTDESLCEEGRTALAAVSYTHLDVYKRQDTECEMPGSSLADGKGRLAEKEGGLEAAGGRKAFLVGIGMGVLENMTGEALSAFREADCILGSGRMLDDFRDWGKPVSYTHLDVYKRQSQEWKGNSPVRVADWKTMETEK